MSKDDQDIMQTDLKDYLHYMDSFDLEDEEKEVFLQTLWNIIESFVDRAFNADATQLVINNSRHMKKAGQDSAKRIRSKDQQDHRE